MIRRTHRQHSPAPARTYTYTYTYLMAADRELAGQGSLTVAHRAAQEAEAQAARLRVVGVMVCVRGVGPAAARRGVRCLAVSPRESFAA